VLYVGGGVLLLVAAARAKREQSVRAPATGTSAETRS
jgi:hypothetical protein